MKNQVIAVSLDAHKKIKQHCLDNRVRIPAAVDNLIAQAEWARHAEAYMRTIAAPLPPLVASLLNVSPFAPTEK